MADETQSEMSGLRKAAVLTMMLGPEKAAEAVARCGLGESEVARLAAELARIGQMDDGTRQAVVEEFTHLAGGQGPGLGGLATARELLRRTLGPEKAEEIIVQVRPRRAGRPFSSLAELPTAQLVAALRAEQPRATAVVLRHLPRKKAGEVLSGLPEEIRLEAVMGVVKGGEPLREALRQMESALGRKAMGLGGGAGNEEEREESAAAGPRTLVEILNQADLSVESAVLEALAERDPKLGEQVRQSMFVFDDLARLEPRAVQLAVREVEPSDLAMALKGAPEDIKAAVFENLSENAAAGLKEDLESLGPVRRRDVLAAQEKLVMGVRSLVEEGKVNIRREEEEEDEMVE